MDMKVIIIAVAVVIAVVLGVGCGTGMLKCSPTDWTTSTAQ